MLGFGILIPLVPYMADRFGVSPQLITPILGSYSLCQLLAAPLWGRLSDRYGRRPILMSSLAGACVSYLLLGGARNTGWLLASRILAGLMAGNIAAAFAYASDVSPPEKRAATLGLIGAAIGVGFTLGPPLGGVLSGKDPARADFLAPALVSAFLSVLAILLVRFALPESHTAEHRRLHAGEPRRGAPALEAAIAGLVLCGIGLGAYNPSAFALASKQSRSHDRGAVLGAYAASASLARVIGPFTSGPIYALLGAAAPFLIGACVTLPAAWLVRRVRGT